MKKKLKQCLCIVSFMLLYFTCGCSSFEDARLDEDTDNIQTRTEANGFHSSERVSLTEAMEIASTLLFKDSKVHTPVSVEYVMAKKAESLRQFGTDTIAYLFNYPNNGGYAIILNNNRIHPFVVGESKGSFSLGSNQSKRRLANMEEKVLHALKNVDEHTASESDYVTGYYMLGVWDESLTSMTTGAYFGIKKISK